MNRSRIIILGIAALAAIAAAFLVRGLLGGGTESSAAATAPKAASTVRVLIAAADIQAGTKVTPAAVRWQVWPKSAVDENFITAQGSPSINKVVEGTVARMPIMTGEPLTTAKIIHADSAGFMSAQLMPGMRAISIAISAESGAGGYILPNDRVDLLLTRATSGSGKHRNFATTTLLSDVRVLAIGNTYKSGDGKDGDNKKYVVGKTATLELTPKQAEMVAQAGHSGSLSLSLRPLGEGQVIHQVAETDDGGNVAIIRYGVTRVGLSKKGE